MRANLTTLLLISAILQVSASSYAQKITLSEKNASLTKVFDKIRDQSGYGFVFTSSMLKEAKRVSINVKSQEIELVLKDIFSDQPLAYVVKNQTVIISKKEKPSFLDKLVDAFTPPIDVYGVVLDENGLPLPGATIKVKGLQQSTTTDGEGKFSLKGVDDKAMLVISFIGYAPKEVAAKSSVSVSLEIQSAELQEVNVAYGKTTQQALTGAVTVVKGEQIQNLPNRSFDKSLQGLVPGLQITTGSGQPGSGVGSMVLRGIATASTDAFSGASIRNPLIVVDGVPVTQDLKQIVTSVGAVPGSNALAQINPSDIESISVLKDASAIALYGSKASNGVIIVTTKKGRSGQARFTFRSQTDLAGQASGRIEVISQPQYLDLLYQTYKNADPVAWNDNTITSDLQSKFPLQEDGSFYQASDWRGALFENTATTFSNELSVSGGSDKGSYYVNLEVINQDGIVRSTGFDRKSLRLNLDNSPLPWLRLGVNSMLSYNLQNYANLSGQATSFAGIDFISPLNPIRLQSGQYNTFIPFGAYGSTIVNPVAESKYNINRSTAYRGLLSFNVEARFLKKFAFKTIAGADYLMDEKKEKNDPRLYTTATYVPKPRITERNDRQLNLIATNTLNYSDIIDKNSFDVLVGQEAQVLTGQVLGAEALGNELTNPYFQQVTSPGYSVSYITGNAFKQTLLSYFGRANYVYDNRYSVTLALRRDGSSRFGDQQRWGNYWSAGSAWIISNEKFLMDSKALSFLKVRGSVGNAGSSLALDPYVKYTSLDATARYNGEPSVVTNNVANPDIKWEKTFTWDIGLEARLFGSRLSLNADVYSRKTSDLIYLIPLPTLTGASSPVPSNIGDMNNRGVEVSASLTLVQKENFKWSLSGNWSTNNNKLVKANTNLALLVTEYLGNEVGRNFNSYYLPVWAGVNPADGKPQWSNEDGTITDDYYQAKRQFVGKPQPDGFGSVSTSASYKNLELAVRLYYQYGAKIYDNSLSSTLLNDGAYPYMNQAVNALDYWRKPGDISSNPRRILNNVDGGTNASTRYLFDANYLQFQNISLSYTLPEVWTRKIKMDRIRIYGQTNNLYTFKENSGNSPDNADLVGAVGLIYPLQKTFSIGLNANF